MRTPFALPPSSNGKERAMLLGRRLKQTVSLKERLAVFAKKMREDLSDAGSVHVVTLSRIANPEFGL
jgi:hypothetical protein